MPGLALCGYASNSSTCCQAWPRRSRSRRQSRGGRSARCRHGSRLHRAAPDTGDDRDRRRPRGRRRRRPFDPERRPHDTVPARARAPRRTRARGYSDHGRRHHPEGGHGRPARAGHRTPLRSRHADGGSRPIHSRVVRRARAAGSVTTRLRELSGEVKALEAKLREGGGADKIARQHKQGKLTARERIAGLCDPATRFLEIGLLVASDAYDGQAPAAGVVTGIGTVEGRPVVIVANDATVKAGSWWPETIGKMLRAQEIAMRCRIPIIYLVDSAGVNLPYQGGVFPGQYGASRLFYYNSIMRRYLRIPQLAAVMGQCIAGGAYLPALSDLIVMVKGTSFMGLGGPNLVKGATGQSIDGETLGGAVTHTEISGVAHYAVDGDEACLEKLRELVAMLPREQGTGSRGTVAAGTTESLY